MSSSTGEGLGNKFLSHIRETDAIVEVVRCFENSDIIHVEGTVDPIRDIEIINLELILADLESIGNRIEKIEKKVKTGSKDKDEILELEALKKAQVALGENKALRSVDFTKEERLAIKSYNFLTLKPIIYMANINEEDINTGNEYTKRVEEYASREGAKVIKVCAKIEEELSQLDDQDHQDMLEALGIEMSGLDQLIKATYDLLGLATYFTVGKDEVRAWTFRKGMNAKECAGIIHTDFEKGFIRAEVMSYSDLIECGSELKVKEAGKARLEGKDYLMQDGDICYFRFNV